MAAKKKQGLVGKKFVVCAFDLEDLELTQESIDFIKEGDEIVTVEVVTHQRAVTTTTLEDVN